MTKIGNLTELAKLELYRVALANAKSNPEITEILSDVGFSAQSLEEGEMLYADARKAYDQSISAREKRLERSKNLKLKVAALEEKFLIDRQKAKIVFKNDEIASGKLLLNSTLRSSYVKRIELAKKFYTGLAGDPALTEQLSKLNFSTADVDTGLAGISEIEKARTEYFYEKGISQDTTNSKAQAMSLLYEWMGQFFSLSKIAFRKNPQLMETFGIVVKN